MEKHGYSEVPIISLKLIKTLLLILSAGLSFGQTTGVCNTPTWSRQILPELGSDRSSTRPSILDDNRAGVVFLDDNRLAAYAVVHDPGQLSSRKDPQLSSPFQLQIWVLDAKKGEILFQRSFGTRVHDSSVQSTVSGLLVKTGNSVRLVSPELTSTRELQFPSTAAELRVNVSPSGRTIVVNQIQQLEEMSRFDAFDAATLELEQSWTERPPLYHHYSASDKMLAAVDFSSHSIIVAPFGGHKWRSIANSSGFCASMNMPTLLNDYQLVYGCDKLILMTTEGAGLMSVPFTSSQAPSGKTASSSSGRDVAISLDTRRVTKHTFSEATVELVSIEIQIYDLVARKRIFTESVTPVPKNTYNFALSPSASMLAIINDRTLSTCVIPK